MYSCTLYTNKSYHRFGHKQSAKCSFCPFPIQTLLHLTVDCPEVSAFRDRVAARWQGEPMTTNRWVLGHEAAPNPLERAKDYIAREVLMYVHRANWEESPLSLDGVRGALRAQQTLEYAIAEKNDRLITHLRKWDAIKPLSGMQLSLYLTSTRPTLDSPSTPFSLHIPRQYEHSADPPPY